MQSFGAGGSRQQRVFCKFSCREEYWALTGSSVSATGLEQPREEVPHLDMPQAPLNLGGFSPRYVKYVWSVAADSGTNLESCWQPHKQLRSCRGVGSKQAGMFSAHTGKAQP